MKNVLKSVIQGALALVILVSMGSVLADSGWTCQVGSTLHKDGDNFTTVQSGPCVTYQCKGGLVHTLQVRCSRNGQCMDIGHSWTSQCMTYECQENNGAIGVKIVKGGCMVSGQCLGVNKVYQQGCFNYTCEQRDHRLGPTFRLLLKDWGCSYGNTCVPPNYTITHNCIEQRCEERNSSVGMYDLSQACMLSDNTCLKVGDTVVEKCKTFKCSQQDFLGIKVFSLEPISALCQDADGKCHGAGETFPMRFNTDIMNDCTCTISGINPHYSCGHH